MMSSKNGTNWGPFLAIFIPAFVAIAIFVGDTIYQRDQTKIGLVSAVLGEVSALTKYQAGLPKLAFLNSVFLKVKEQPACLVKFSDNSKKQTKCLKGLIEPIDKPPERSFVIYESNSDKLGMLGADLSKHIAEFYALSNLLRGKARLFGDGRFMKFRRADKIIWLKDYIKLHKVWILSGCALKARIEKRFEWKSREPAICRESA